MNIVVVYPAQRRSLAFTVVHKAALICVLSFLAVKITSAQTGNEIERLTVAHLAWIDTIKVRPAENTPAAITVASSANPFDLEVNPAVKRRRVLINSSLHTGLYVGSLLLLDQAWYADYPRSRFHVFNDNKEWLQVDKVGHAWTAYQLSRTSMATWKWAGLSRKQQIWLGGLAGAGYQTVIELLDGFSSEWGWSWGDFAANCAGSGLVIGQQLAWDEQRISFKFSFHKMDYGQAMLNNRADSLFGASLPERALKDYNGQTYWLSANLRSFFPESRIPRWLNLSVGYGATGLFGGYNNKWLEGTTPIDRSDIARSRQWYLAPDIDFTQIPTRSKFLKSVFFVLNSVKLPAPALMLSNGKLKAYAVYF